MLRVGSLYYIPLKRGHPDLPFPEAGLMRAPTVHYLSVALWAQGLYEKGMVCKLYVGMGFTEGMGLYAKGSISPRVCMWTGHPHEK